MPTRTEVITSLKSKYDAQITGNQSANDIENAIARLAICQLVDAVFGGGGGGGGSTSPADIASGVDQSALVDNIRINLDEFINNRKFRDESIAALDSTTNPLLDTIYNAILNIDNVDLEDIRGLLNTLIASQLTQSQVSGAINGALDIDTIIARLVSIDNKTVAAPSNAKLTITGTSIAATNANLLDPSGAGAWTDVRQYQSCELTLQASPTAPFGFANGLQSALDALGNGISPQPLTAFDSLTGNVNPTASMAANGFIRLRYDLTGVNFVRFGTVTANAGNKVTGVFSPFAIVNRVLAQISSTVSASVNNVVQTQFQSAVSNVDLNGVITSSVTSPIILLGSNTAYTVTFNVTAITGTNTQSIVRIQESPDGGSTWKTVYTFEPMTVASGARQYKSPILTTSANRIRYIETVTGTTPSINRIAFKNVVNTGGIVNPDTRSTTAYNANLAAIDVPAYGVIRAIGVMPSVATPLWLQIHDSVAPIVPGSQPRQSIRIPVDGLVLGAAYFGNLGRQLGGAIDPRITISTSANGYTPISLAANTVQLYIEAN